MYLHVLVAGGARLLKDVLHEPLGSVGFPELVVCPGEHPGRQQRLKGVAGLMEQSLALLPALSGGLVVLIIGRGVTENEEGHCDTPRVPVLTMEGERLHGPYRRRRRVAVSDRH